MVSHTKFIFMVGVRYSVGVVSGSKSSILSFYSKRGRLIISMINVTVARLVGHSEPRFFIASQRGKRVDGEMYSVS